MRLIDANRFEVVGGVVPKGYDFESYLAGNREILEMIDNAPTIDAVEVVRCRDCIAFGKSPYGHPGLGWCRIYGHHFKPDYYCASGKRNGDASSDD